MCGIAGKINLAIAQPVSRCEIEAMLSVMGHRGPDGQGVHLDGSVGLGHLRLSIIDLATGAQPLGNEDESVWITFNGEIYNFPELREKLLARGHKFKTHSDTEVIVHLYEEYGRDCVNHLRGMFAFAIWDSRQKRLFIARDRVGIKPLYYFASGDFLAFASELKSLLALEAVPRDLNEQAVDAFWCFNYLPGELTMFKGIRKLLPGYWMEVNAQGRVTTHQYWDLNFSQRTDNVSLEAAADQLSELLRETIRQHMISDVPVGFLLSGGMDSSAVLSYAARETDKEISTFTIGFDGKDIVDERPYARLMAAKFRSRHYETTISAKQFWDYLPKLMWHLDEPVCEPPAVALHYISELARKHVKVLLSGEGGDEAFGGYPNYPNQLALQKLRGLFGPLRGVVGSGAVALGQMTGKSRWADYGRMLPLDLSDYYWSRVGSPFLRESNTSSANYRSDFRSRLNGNSQETFVRWLFDRVKDLPELHQMLYLDTKTWLPDDLLVKADKVTMASSLELRVPLLDHKVLEFAAALPPHFKVKGRETKHVLKAAFAKVLPQEIINRKKVGFPVPYGRWLARELWQSASDLLTAPSSFVSRYFETSSIHAMLNRHRDTGSLQRELFSLVALELWHQGCQRAESIGDCGV
jgi:asparagine synthase (glutamine-hydrolysing)